MGMRYAVRLDSNSTGRFTIHPSHAIELGIHGQEQVALRFGTKVEHVRLCTNDDVNPFDIWLSKDTCSFLRLPRFPAYELRWQEPELIIGPYMGILAATTHRQLYQRVRKLHSFVSKYKQIGGAVLVFSLEGVNRQHQTIRGFLYHPYQKRWVEGVYGYPSAMFSILEASMTKDWEKFTEIVNHLHQELGDRLFNFPVFDKWEMHSWLSKYPQIAKHLPMTILYQHPQQIYDALLRYNRVYIKPILGRLGMGVLKAEWENGGVRVKLRNRQRNRKFFLRNYEEFVTFFRDRLTVGQYIIQNAVRLTVRDGRIIDFRLILVKDQAGEWQNAGLFGRYGAKQSIVSNITAGGFAENGVKTLRKTLRLSNDEANDCLQSMTDLAIDAAKAMEDYGIHCGNLGLDLALDRSDKLWILEINNQNPDHYIALLAGDKATYHQARLYNMQYCKRLAGFPL
ncbi:YheC/YheD family protein [Brevibacillus fulvus]|uniref:Glutathione synthase/RimK-type ligase-like ATP-grasp enzyme n=1 Tax=Brevibacillus fulvus TaxID=1125967 RepID=A0A938Y283_9BACL|nr:YheC/YheD family protein [Brevibacillus fulvus]MBM7590292.1 glutathione synthase/RimK-type ligase-like ATP-grasp enzyme [Brevibacillus fulvus]